MKAARSKKQERNWRLPSHSVRELEERTAQLNSLVKLPFPNLMLQRSAWVKARRYCLAVKRRSLQKDAAKVRANQRLARLQQTPRNVFHHFLRRDSISGECFMISV